MTQFGQVEDMETAASSLFVPLRLTVPTDLPFHADVTEASVGPMPIARMAYTQGLVRRLPRLINSGDRPLTIVTLQRRGRSVVTQDDRQCQGGPGALIAYDTRRPYDLACPESSDVIALALPQEMLGPSGDVVSRRTAVAVPTDRGIRSVIQTFIIGLADTALSDEENEMRGPDAVRLADAAASLIVTALTGMPAERVELPTSLAGQILAYAEANLHDPDLSPDSVARRYGISVRYLHRLMQAQDIRFSSWVRRKRLSHIHRDLLDPRMAGTTAAVIAARWGIHDPGHLSRLLRAEYGRNAAEIRASVKPTLLFQGGRDDVGRPGNFRGTLLPT